jgi:hypothetical protein
MDRDSKWRTQAAGPASLSAPRPRPVGSVFDGDVVAIEEAAEHAWHEALAVRGKQIFADLDERDIRRFLDEGKAACASTRAERLSPPCGRALQEPVCFH